VITFVKTKQIQFLELLKDKVCEFEDQNFKVILPLNKSIKPHYLVFIKIHLNHKYILKNDKLQYDLELISSKQWDVTEYLFAYISNSSRL